MKTTLSICLALGLFGLTGCEADASNYKAEETALDAEVSMPEDIELMTQEEADEAARVNISDENAEAELQALIQEIGG